MSLSIRNHFAKKGFKGALVICSFFSIVLLEPFQAFLTHAEMLDNLVFQLTIIPVFMGPLLPIGVTKMMKEQQAVPMKFQGFLRTVSWLMPKSMLGKAIYWTVLSYTLVGFPAIFAFNLWGVESMTGYVYMAFKVLTTAVYVSGLSFLISSACLSDAVYQTNT